MYFNHKAHELLRAFPLDATLADGSLFWQSPKRPPTPIVFDENNKTHFTFVLAFSKILARVHNICVTERDLEEDAVKDVLKGGALTGTLHFFMVIVKIPSLVADILMRSSSTQSGFLDRSLEFNTI